MQYYTPLRYPGGKRRLAPTVIDLLRTNGLRNIEYVEPFAGGAAVALALLMEEHATRVHINDLARPVYAFWHTVLNHSEELCSKIESTPVSVRQWHIQRAVYEDRKCANLFDLGFSTLFLNRANRSGILNGGMIGGKRQEGEWGIDARYNRAELVARVRRIARYKNRIKIYRQDASTFVAKTIPALGDHVFAFFDPPYIENGERLYLNKFSLEDHRRLANQIQALAMPWIVSYDYAAVREKLFPGRRHIVYKLPYSAQGRYRGQEALFFSDALDLPLTWQAGQFSMVPTGTLRGRLGKRGPHVAVRKGGLERVPIPA